MALVWRWQCCEHSLGTPGSTPLYLCLPPFRDSVGSDQYFPITGGTYKEMASTKEHLKHRDFVVQRHWCIVIQQGTGSSREPSQGAGISDKAGN
jgi:hypothetical protein